MLKIIIALAGFVLGATGYAIQAAKKEAALVELHRLELNKTHTKAFNGGWESATAEFKTFHNIFHEDCTTRFCPK